MNYHEVSIDQSVDTSCFRAGCNAETREVFKKTTSRFYWFDFTVCGQRYRGSTGETKAVRATKVASMKLVRAVEHGDVFSAKATVLSEFSARFLTWLEETMVEERTRKYYRNGCRLLKTTQLFSMRLTEITTEDSRGRWVKSCTILTTMPNTLSSTIHDRMPIILSPDNYDVWLDPRIIDVQVIAELLKPCEPSLMRSIP